MRTSYSDLQTFEQCPQKFKFRVIDKIKAPRSVETAFGTSVHAALRFMFSHDPLFPTFEEVAANFVTSWSVAASKVRPALEKTLMETYEEHGKMMLKKFYQKNPPWLASVVDTESHFEVSIPDPAQNESHIVAGIIDRIDKIGDGEYEIIDYKTSRKLPSQDMVNGDFQLSLYHMALLSRWPHIKAEKVSLSLYFLKHGEKLTSHRDTNALAATKEKIIQTIRAISERTTKNNFPPMPSPLCDWCPYKPLCPAWRHLYKNPSAGGAPAPDEAQLQKALQEYFAIKEEDTKQDKRVKELQSIIRAYMDVHGVDRVFDERGYFVAKRLQQRFSYDFEKIHTLLKEAGLENAWQKILEADDKKLKAILPTLPPHIRQGIMQAKILTKEFTTLAASSKPVKK